MTARKTKVSAPLVHQSHSFEVPKDSTYKVALVADTHSKPHPNAKHVLAALKPDLILHGGDIGALSVLDELGKHAPLFAVRGNIDEKTPGLADTMDLEFKCGSRSLLRAVLVHIAVYGPKLRADIFRLAREHEARMVLCGHSHVPFIGRDKGIVLCNPGSIGPRRFSLPITLGLLEISEKTIGLKHLNCETGQVWTP